MKRVVVDRFGGPEVLEVVDEDAPRPGPGEVRVRVLAAGVSFTDALIRAGTYLGGPKPPFTPGYEFVGTVDKLGAGVSGFELGQWVGAIPVYGSHADYICVPDWWLVPVPAGLDPAEAAIVVFNYVTAYQMLHRTASVREGERLLVHGAGGGVGTAVLELGRLAGLELYGTGSERDSAVISELGARPIDYTNEDFVSLVRELTGDGVDVALDGIGGKVALHSYRALRRGGRLVMFGHYGTLVHGRKSLRAIALFYLAGALVFAGNVLPNGKRVRVFQVAKLRDRKPEWFREDASTLFQLLLAAFLIWGVWGALDRQRIVFDAAGGRVEFTSRLRPWACWRRPLADIAAVEASEKEESYYSSSPGSVTTVTHHLHLRFRDGFRCELSRSGDAASIRDLASRIESRRR